MQAAAKVSKNRRLTILAVFSVALGTQAAFAVAVVEPYPSLIMPAFAGAANSEGQYATTRLEISIQYEDGFQVHPHEIDLMDGFRFSSALPSAKYMFHPDGDGAKSGLHEGGDVKSWLSEQARALGGGREPSFINFCWHEETIDVDDASVTDNGPCKNMRIDL